MMKREILSISGHGVKGQGQIFTLCMYKTYTGYSYCPITFKLFMLIAHDERMNSIGFWSQGQGQGQIWHSVYKTFRTQYRLEL